MAHKEQQDFFIQVSSRFPRYFLDSKRILEVGSQNINGSIREFFSKDSEYLGIDLGLARDVDWIVPGELIELPDKWADVCISTECFEHCENWKDVFVNMIRILSPGGLLILTCASLGRATHGTIDSDTSTSPFTTSYYRNLGPDDIQAKIASGHYFSSHAFEVNSESHDLYFWGVRSNSSILEHDNFWEDPNTRLARAQGQLAQAAARHSLIQSELSNAKEKMDRLETALREAKDIAVKEKSEATRAIALAERAENELTTAKEFIDYVHLSISWRLASPIRALKHWVSRIFGS